MAENSRFFDPFLQAWAMLRVPAALVVFVILVVQVVAYQVAFTGFVEQRDFEGLRKFVAVTRLAMGAVWGVIILVLGRKFLASGIGVSGSMVARWIGLLVLYVWLRNQLMVLIGIISVPIGVSENSQLLSVALSLLPNLLLFPVVVRLLALAGGQDFPRLFSTWGKLWNPQWHYFGAYVLAMTLPSVVLMLLGGIFGADQPTPAWLVINGVLAGLFSTYAYLIAVTAARALVPIDHEMTAVFS